MVADHPLEQGVDRLVGELGGTVLERVVAEGAFEELVAERCN